MTSPVDAIANRELKLAKEPTHEEELAEARAWGFDTVEEFYAAYDAAVQEAGEEAE